MRRWVDGREQRRAVVELDLIRRLDLCWRDGLVDDLSAFHDDLGPRAVRIAAEEHREIRARNDAANALLMHELADIVACINTVRSGYGEIDAAAEYGMKAR